MGSDEQPEATAVDDSKQPIVVIAEEKADIEQPVEVDEKKSTDTKEAGVGKNKLLGIGGKNLPIYFIAIATYQSNY